MEALTDSPDFFLHLLYFSYINNCKSYSRVCGVWKDARGCCGLNNTHSPLLLCICRSHLFIRFPSYLIWSPEIENCLCETKIKFGHGEILSVTAVLPTCADHLCVADWWRPRRRDQCFGIMKNGRHLERAREVGKRVATSWDLSSSYSCYSLIIPPPGADPLAYPRLV